MADQWEEAKPRDADWLPLRQPAPVADWIGATDQEEDELLIADLPNVFERLRRAWRGAWDNEHEAGTAFVAAPLAFALGIILYFTMPMEPAWWATLPLLPPLAVVARNATGWRRVVTGACLLVTLGFGIGQVRTAVVATPTLSGPTVGVLTGQVVWAERKPGGARRYTIEVEDFEAARPVVLNRVRLTVRKRHAALAPGDGLRVRARLVAPSGPVTPGGYDFAFFAWFTGRGADGIAFGSPERLSNEAGMGFRVRLSRWRFEIGERIAAAMDERTGPLAKALIIGDRSSIDDDMAESLRASGLAHILAISGLHMMLVTGLVFAVLRKGCATLSVGSQRVAVKKYAAVGAFVFGTVYLFLSGMNVSTQRAYIMVCVMLVAVLLDRRALTLHNVAIAAFIVLAVQPEAVFAPGFQMSFGAATALIAAHGALLRWRRAREKRTDFVSSVGRGMAALSFTSLVAGFATAPFAAYHFHRIAAYGLVANLLAMPVVTFLVMPLAVLSVLAMPFGADTWVLPMLGWSLDVVAAVSNWVSQWDGWARVGHVGTTAFVLSVVAFCALALMRTWLRTIGVAFAAASATAYVLQPSPVALIHEDGRNAAVLGENPVFLAGKPESFVNALFAEAFHPAGFDPAGKGGCDREGCATTLADGSWLVVSRRSDGLADDCRNASVLVTWDDDPCAGHVEPPMVLSRSLLRQRGSIALYDRAGTTTSDQRWQAKHSYGAAPRPWTAHRYADRPGQ